MKAIIQGLLRPLGITIARIYPPHITPVDRRILDAVRPYTMTGTERILALIDAVRYLAQNRIAGDIAECGVWRGGSMVAIALTLLSENDRSRTLYLYDTFSGMSAPTARDRDAAGTPAEALLKGYRKGTGLWCEAPLEDVRNNLAATGYPADKVRFVVGKVEDTIPAQVPGPLALLRLDTDWYESTLHELHHLYPLLVSRGVLIIDDYGHWQGSRQATDEYFATRGEKPLLQRIDYSGRLLVKTEAR